MKIEIGVSGSKCKILREARFKQKRVLAVRCNINLGINSKNTKQGLELSIGICN